jgi:hypothetical protein
MVPQQLLYPGFGQAFGQLPPPQFLGPASVYGQPSATSGDSSAQHQPAAQNSFEQSALIGALSDLSLQGGSGPWIADSGASTHLSANTSGILSRTRPVYNCAPVIVGNGDRLSVTHIGHSSFPSPSRPLYLQNVLVTPQIIHNLLSVRRFTTDNNVTMEFDPFGVSMKDLHTRAVLLRCNSEGDLYPLFSTATSTSPLALAASSSDRWHRRLGHPGVSSAFNKSISCNKSRGLCHACQLGKHTCLPFSPSSSSTSAAFQLVHCDLWTAPMSSLSGFKYYLIIIDDFTHYMWTFPLRLKSDVHQTFSHFHAFIRTHHHTNIGTI